MKKEIKVQFAIISIIIAIFIIVLAFSYANDIRELHIVKELPSETNKYIDEQLNYELEFCAYKMNSLLTELHFVEKSVAKEEAILGSEQAVQTEEETVVGLEMREIKEIKAEFDMYKGLCNSFDIQKTEVTCKRFISESNNDLAAAEEKEANALSFKSRIEIKLNDLRRAKRIHKEVLKECASYSE